MIHSTTCFARRASQRPRPRRGWGWAAGLAFTVLGCAFAGVGQAEPVGSKTLDGAVSKAIGKLLEDLRKEGHQVQEVSVDPDDLLLMEEGLMFRLPLSDKLREMSRRELNNRGVAVPGSESKAGWVLQGRWRRSQEDLDLTMYIMEVAEEDGPHTRASAPVYAPIKTIPSEHITPTLDHWGPALVQRLERNARVHRKRDVRFQPIDIEGDVGKSDRLEQRLTTWIKGAFAGMRRNRLYTLVDPEEAPRGETNGTLRARAVVHAETVWISLTVHDDGGRQLASDQIELKKGLFPPDIWVDPEPRRFRAKVRAVVSEGLDREGAARAMRNLARARVVAQALGVPPPSIDVVRTEADGVRALTGTLDRGIPVDERFSGPWPDGDSGLEAELDARIAAVGDAARPKVEASLDKGEFRAGEPIRIRLSAEETAHAAVFSWGADNRVVRLYPNPKTPDLVLEGGSRVTLPRDEEGVKITSAPMPGNAEDHEAFLVLAGGGRFAVDGLAPRVGETMEKTIDTARSGAGFFDALARLDTSRLALIVLPYRVTAR